MQQVPCTNIVRPKKANLFMGLHSPSQVHSFAVQKIRIKMKKTVTLIASIVLLHTISFAQNYLGPVFVHITSSANTSAHITDLNTGLTGTADGKKFIFCHHYGKYNTSSQGLWYDGTQYTIFNQNLSTIPAGDGYAVLLPQTGGTLYQHTVTAANSSGNTTELDNAALNGNPNAVFFFSKTFDGVIYDTAHLGIWYSSGKWYLYNEDYNKPIAVGLTINIFVPNSNATLITHTVTAANTSTYLTTLDHPLLNGKPNAMPFFSHNYTTGAGAVYNNAAGSMWYDDGAEKWTVYNDNFTNLPIGASYSILIAGTSVPAGIGNNDLALNHLELTQNANELFVKNNANAKMQKVEVVNMNGVVCYTKNIDLEQKVTCPIEALAKGLYVVRVSTDQGILIGKISL
jgi:hypothetical protein